MREKILELKAQGYNQKQIAEELGCSKSTVSYHCNNETRAKAAARTDSTRKQCREYIKKLKTKTPCADCGINYPYWIMQFDHLRDKEFTIGLSGNHSSMTRVLEEIDKCEIVCANCHANRTHMRKFGDVA